MTQNSFLKNALACSFPDFPYTLTEICFLVSFLSLYDWSVIKKKIYLRLIFHAFPLLLQAYLMCFFFYFCEKALDIEFLISYQIISHEYFTSYGWISYDWVYRDTLMWTYIIYEPQMIINTKTRTFVNHWEKLFVFVLVYLSCFPNWFSFFIDDGAVNLLNWTLTC